MLKNQAYNKKKYYLNFILLRNLTRSGHIYLPTQGQTRHMQMDSLLVVNRKYILNYENNNFNCTNNDFLPEVAGK